MADIGVRGFGATLAQAFEQAAMALTAVITDPAVVRPSQRIGVSCEGLEEDLLLYDWLNALVYEMATRRLLFSRFELEYSEGRLDASVWGEPRTAFSRHTFRGGNFVLPGIGMQSSSPRV